MCLWFSGDIIIALRGINAFSFTVWYLYRSSSYINQVDSKTFNRVIKKLSTAWTWSGFRLDFCSLALQATRQFVWYRNRNDHYKRKNRQRHILSLGQKLGLINQRERGACRRLSSHTAWCMSAGRRGGVRRRLNADSVALGRRVVQDYW